MHILIRAILTGIFFMLPVFPAYSASLVKAEPLAQVYEIKGRVTVKNSGDGTSAEVKKGYLLGGDDSLTLDKGASVGLYFKNGGKKEVQAKNDQSLYKVADLLPGTEAYGGEEPPDFGATREMAPPEEGPYTAEIPKVSSYTAEIPGRGFKTAEFFYPQETIVLESPPLIEFRIYNGSGEGIVPGGGIIGISGNGVMAGSLKFDSLAFGSAYEYRCPKLKGGTEYTAEIDLDLKAALGSGVSISFPFYVAGIPDKSSMSAYRPFSDSLYRSVQSVGSDYKGRKYTVWIIKQLDMRSNAPHPVIVIEFFIT
jgi:hypothetical protein